MAASRRAKRFWKPHSQTFPMMRLAAVYHNMAAAGHLWKLALISPYFYHFGVCCRTRSIFFMQCHSAVAMASTVQAHDWRRLYQRGVDASPTFPPCLPG